MTEDAPVRVFDALKATPTPVRYLLGGVLVNQLGAFVQTFLVLYLTYRGASVSVAGLSLVAYSIGSVFGTMLGAEITHRFGPRATIMAAMGASAPLVASISWLSGPGMLWALLVVVGLAGLFTQAYRPAAAVMLSDLMPERYQVMAFSMMRIALNIGAALAPLIAAVVILVDWDLLFWIDGGTALVYALLAFALLPKKTVEGEAEQGAEAAAAPEAAASGQAAGGRSAYATMLRDRKYMLFLGAILLGSLTYAQGHIALPLELAEDDYPTSFYSTVLTVSSVVLITCELKITAYLSRLPKHVRVITGHLVEAVGLAVYGLTSRSGAFTITGAVLVVCGIMIAAPSMFAHPATFPAAVKARYIGTMQAVGGAASALAPLFGVFLWTRLGGGFWLLCGVVTAVAGLLALAGVKQPPEPAPAKDADAGTEGTPEVVGGTS
ncbi:MFS transporter [Streptomyces sp. A1547]|uniref:MFS transporter n=1 Tax=Streptomyces sp. A1547 TaxID=2563105 RepID=UPI00061DF28C|nr:MFS transporter [Streptomyces sp. A1547]KJY42917.1 MFS transporter [Streptomyces sp. NRRL S-444]THA34678.1 MFS transporter [Streptomyces sp. A1547]